MREYYDLEDAMQLWEIIIVNRANEYDAMEKAKKQK